MQGSECVATCASGSFATAGVCKACPSGCSACSDNKTCTRCNNGVLNDGLCTATCDAQEYIDRANNSCKSCHASCSICSGANNNQCSACNEGFLLKETTCVAGCRTGLYLSQAKCLPCSDNCLECSDGKICSKCNASTVLSANACASSCPVGTFTLNG